MMEFNYKWNLKDGYPAPGIEKHGSTVFSTFSCGGGSSMGYKLAGYNVVGSNDIDPKMMQIYRKNHNPSCSWVESITTFKNKSWIPDELFDLDILDGSPPCSSFSMAGNREKDWGKEKKFREGQADQVLDTLFFDFIDLADRLKPKVVVAENVKGLLLGDAIAYVREIYDQFEAAGYYVQHWLLDASRMGVPQKRERVFFIALRKDLADPFMHQKDMFTRAPLLNLSFHGKPILFGDVRDEHGTTNGVSEESARLLELVLPSDNAISDINEREMGKTSRFNALIVHDHKTCPTITAGEKNYRYHDKLSMTEGDYKKVGTFPMDYDFNGLDPKYVIGMSVPPVMMAQVAHQIFLQWLSKI